MSISFAPIGWSLGDLVKKAGITANAVTPMQNNPQWMPLQRTPEAAGVEFIDENGGGVGVRLRKPSTKKARMV